MNPVHCLFLTHFIQLIVLLHFVFVYVVRLSIVFILLITFILIIFMFVWQELWIALPEACAMQPKLLKMVYLRDMSKYVFTVSFN